MTPKRMGAILEARGVEGVLIFSYPKAPAKVDIDLSNYATVAIGRAVVTPRVCSVDVDHFQGFFTVWKEVMRRGYKRPALVLSDELDERTEHSWSAAYRFASNDLPKSRQQPVIYTNTMDAEQLVSVIRKRKPDVLLIGAVGVLQTLKQAGMLVPEEVAAAVLFRDTKAQFCAGIGGCDERVGARSIELLAEQLRSHRIGVPTTPETLLLSGVWQEGPELPWKSRAR